MTKQCATCGKTFDTDHQRQRACSRECRRRTITDAERKRLRGWSREAGRLGALASKRKHFERVRSLIGDMTPEAAFVRGYKRGYGSGAQTGFNRGQRRGYEEGYMAAMREHAIEWQLEARDATDGG